MFLKIIKLSIIVAVLSGTAFFLWFMFGRGEDAIKTGESDDSSLAILKEEKSEKTDSVSAGESGSAYALTKKYENAQYGFSFDYPSGFKAREFPEDEGRISLIIQNEKTNQIVQIYITPYDDPDFAVSAERIRRDIPDLPFSNSADVIVGGKAKGVAFFSQNKAFGGDTAEAWFAYGGNFFQVTAYRKYVGLLEEIIKSWKFQ